MEQLFLQSTDEKIWWIWTQSGHVQPSGQFCLISKVFSTTEVQDKLNKVEGSYLVKFKLVILLIAAQQMIVILKL